MKNVLIAVFTTLKTLFCSALFHITAKENELQVILYFYRAFLVVALRLSLIALCGIRNVFDADVDFGGWTCRRSKLITGNVAPIVLMGKGREKGPDQ